MPSYFPFCRFPSGAEPPAEEVVRLITAAGGVSVLAHPWTLARGKGGGTGCYHLLQRLHAVGLRGMEVYKEPRTDFQRETTSFLPPQSGGVYFLFLLIII